jgi:hypothetical protein
MSHERAEQDAPDGTGATPERRRCPRIHYPMPLVVKGEDFEFAAIVQNFSAGGLCSRSQRKMNTGEKVHFLVDLSIAGSEAKTMPRISASGTVIRTRDLRDGWYEFAAEFSEYRFL